MHVIDNSVPRFTTVFRGSRIIVTSNFLASILRVPRVARLDYPSHPRLRIISHDKLALHFYENAVLCGDTINFSTIEFAKGP